MEEVATTQRRFIIPGLVAQAVEVLAEALAWVGKALQEKPIPAEVAEEVLAFPMALVPRLARAARASCASDCIRKARERGKENHAVIQERDKDGGSKSTAL